MGSKVDQGVRTGSTRPSESSIDLSLLILIIVDRSNKQYNCLLACLGVVKQNPNSYRYEL